METNTITQTDTFSNDLPPALRGMEVLERYTGPMDPQHERGRTWYVVGGTLVIAAAAYGILSHDWSLSVVCMVIGALYFLVRNHRSEEHTFVLLDGGVLYDNRFLRWQDLKGFWYVLHNSFDLRLVINGKANEHMRIQLPVTEADHVRLVLARWIPQLQDHSETLLDTIVRICKL